MFRRLLFLWVNIIWLISCLKHYFSFKRSSLDIEHSQEYLLRRILKENAETLFGKRHGFSEIRNVADFRKKIPISTYDSYLPFIALIEKGTQSVLTIDPISALMPSSGSTAASKYIPFTKTLRQDFMRGINPWIFDLFINKKNLLLGSSYWSVTPIGNKNKNRKIKVGFDEDSEYFGKIERFLLNLLFAVPREVAQIRDIENFRYVTLLFLLKDKYLSYISVWNPTFLILLLEPIIDWIQSLVNDIRNGTITEPGSIDTDLKDKIITKLCKDKKRAEELSSIFKQWKKRKGASLGDISLYEEIWPNLSLISCWADGNASHHVQELKYYFPNVEIQPKGLIATEGIVSFPLMNEKGAVLAINSHFFEFIEIEEAEQVELASSGDTKLAHQLQVGKFYSVIITTGGGLYRYRLGDIIKVVGFRKKCPLIRFVTKENQVSDLFGEKLNEYHVSRVLTEAFRNCSVVPRFYMVAPEKELISNHYFYTLFFQFSQKSNRAKNMFNGLLEEIEGRLQENYHYRYCRNLGQLSKLRLFIINSNCDAQGAYLLEHQSAGQRLGAIKSSILSNRIGWSKIFGGNFV